MSGTDPLSARARAPTGRLELLSDEDTDDEYFMQDEASTSSGSSGVEAEHDDAAPEPESEPAPLSNDNVDDITMDYASGSVIFSVQGVRFKIAKCLLQQHSDAFSSMLDMNSSEEETVVLNDSLNAFREFRCVMYTPFLSCLMPNDSRSDTELTTLLDLLEISHKYCAAHIESLALKAALNSCKAEKLAYFPVPSSLAVLRVAHLVSSDDLARPARARILHILWSSTIYPGSSSTPFSDVVSGAHYCIDALKVGQSTHDTALIGAAYYAVMCRTDPHDRALPMWKTDARLTELDRTRLTEGMMRCAHEWQILQNTWGAQGLGCHTNCHHKRNVLDASLRVQALHQVAWFDILGKIAATQVGNSELAKGPVWHCSSAIAAGIADERERVKAELYGYFCGPDSDEMKAGE